MFRSKLWSGKIEPLIITPEMRLFIRRESWMKVQYLSFGFFVCSALYAIGSRQWFELWPALLMLGVSITARYAKNHIVISGMDGIEIGKNVEVKG